jgi:hypothetical protein
MKLSDRLKQRLSSRWDDIVIRANGGCNFASRWYRGLEAAIPPYELPELLASTDGTRIDDPQQWATRRRQEILELFSTYVYGRTPERCAAVEGKIVRRLEGALDGVATMKEVRVPVTDDPSGPAMTLLLLLPSLQTRTASRSPLFLGLNFFGNHTVHSGSEIQLTRSWVPNDRHTRGLPPERLRGLQASSWPIESILARGYGVATAYYGDLVPDRPDGLSLGIHHWYEVNRPAGTSTYSWGAIAGWAWGLSRAMDYLTQDDEVAGNQVVVVGHSRLGKAALWAGAQDERFAMVISNESGCGGAALSRRRFRETLSILNRIRPHWFCDKLKDYDDNEAALPVDQHMLLSLVAPRPLYVASAQLDLGADPFGEFLATRHASRVYRFLGTSGLPTTEMPRPNTSVMGQVGYHIRKGAHGIGLFDWMQFMAFADKHFQRSPAGLTQH